MSDENSVWLRHPERCWALGRVVRQVGTDVEVSLVDTSFPDDTLSSLSSSSSQTTLIRVPLIETHPLDASHLGDSEDIAQMNNMHEAPLLALLDRRYHRDAIYTFTGDILISVNPYKNIPGLYDLPVDEYKERKVPHVFSVAEISYRMMLEETNPSRKNQSMIVSGESGAGKTEACKHVMRYLATLSKRYVEKMAMAQFSSTSPRVSSISSPDSPSSPMSPGFVMNDSSVIDKTSIEKKVLDCNPFLEAFGNAKTARNDNSSRFGKFLKIEYTGGRILGARIRHYLLEKARVVWPNEGERNYHIFYQLTRGATAEERVDLALGGVEDYKYLTSGGMPATIIDGVDDAQEFSDVRSALTNVGIGKPLQRSIFTVVAGLMHLGNVTFRDEGKDSSEAVIANPNESAAAARLLGCPRLPEKLVRRLISVKGRTSSYEVNLNSKQSAVARDSLAKTIYERLFSWLIARTNGILTSRQPATAFVGILDIFGFEIFELNSFEQLCINYANEKLQNLFNHHIFVMEMEQYKTEGVDVSSIAFVNNQLCVDLIEKKPNGLLPLLDEICFLGRETTDLEFLDKIEKIHGKGKHEFFGNPKKRHPSGDRFSVLHFAGEVTYCVKEFIEKNNDTLYTDLEKLMIGSDNSLIHDMFDDDALAASEEALLQEQTLTSSGHEGGSTEENAGHLSPAARKSIPSISKAKTQSVSTIASKFKLQLGLLNETLMSTTPHYVRCIKPNKVKKPHVFDHQMVLNQLLYAGVLETVKVRKQGFPFRETFVEFMRRIMRSGLAKILAPSLVTTGKLVNPPNAIFIEGDDGKAIDTSVTPELMTKCKEMCSLFLSLVLPSNGTLADDQLKLEKSANAIVSAQRSRLIEKAAEATRRATELSKAAQIASSPQAMASKGGATALKAKVAAAAEAKELATTLNTMLAAFHDTKTHPITGGGISAVSKKAIISSHSPSTHEQSSSSSSIHMPQWTTGKLKFL
jgi:myosin V